MALQNYERDMFRCARCSYCKFVPFLMIKEWEFAAVCLSIERYNFHGWSGGGRMIGALSFLRGRIDYSDTLLDMIYQCQMDGACDVSCECYQTFKVLYDKIGKKPPIEVLHITGYLNRLIKEGKIKLTQGVPMTVTYQDPCHLGRLAEPWIHWQGVEKKVMGQLIVHDPPKMFRRGANGVYDPPRDILRGIPGLRFVEMERIREYAWCCGSGGGVKEAYPDFAVWTAEQRIKEAQATGAEAIVTACPWCERNLLDAVKERENKIRVYDMVELIKQAI